MKWIFYLDPVDATTGALRVIPATHLQRNPEQQQRLAALVSSLDPAEVPGTALATEPGDAIAFNIRTWHGSVGGSNNRRSLNIDVFRNPRNPSEVYALNQLGKGHAMATLDYGTARPFNYSRAYLANAGGSAARARWVARLREIGYFEAERVAEGGPVGGSDSRL